VSVNLLQDTVCRRARVAVVDADHATDELAYRLSGTERRILVETASPLSSAIFRPVLEHLSEPPLEFWFTTSARSWDDCLPQTTTLTFASNGNTLRIQVREEGAPGPAGNEATIVPKP
jgi:hypothetical protein